jgi:4-diphosphocytidyl-2-C-methyl-D-erythritol kinase
VTTAPAKINLALLVGPRRPDGKHDVVTVLERIGLVDTVVVERADGGTGIAVEGYPDDSIVRAALEALVEAAGVETSFSATITKRIPVAAGLGGGSSDAAAALRQGNALLPRPLHAAALIAIAARIGADVPFFLHAGPQLGTGDGSTLAPLALPHDYHVVLWIPDGSVKESTAAVYAAFDARDDATAFPEKRDGLLEAIARITVATDLAALPANDLVTSPLATELERLGAFRADVSGAGPALYGLFEAAEDAARAAETLRSRGRVWVTRPLAAP